MSDPSRAASRAHALRRLWRAIGPLAAAMALATPLAAQGAGGRITGTVVDSASGRPLAAVQVMVTGTRFGTATNDAGQYSIAGIPAGAYTLEGRRVGYRLARAANVRVTDGATVTADLRMTTVPLSLEAVVTTGVTDPTSGTRVPFTVGRVEAENSPVPSTIAVETIQG